jgi:hypothetical protein
LPNKV